MRAPGRPRNTNMRLATRASSRATCKVLEMLSTSTSWPDAIWLTAPATALVCASAVPGSASSRSRSTWISTSRIGLLLTKSPLVVAAFWKAGTTSLANSSGSITRVFLT
jgi:hypothetical protein